MAMLKFLHLWLLVAGVDSAVVKHRLIGGEPCGKNERHHQVWVFSPKGFCGGTLIDKQWVLTAAHCYNKSMTGNVSVSAGIHPKSNSTIQEFDIKLGDIHIYDITDRAGDIMLIKLPRAVRGITPAQLPTSSCKTKGEKLQIAGHGSTVDPNGPADRNRPLQCLDLKVTDCPDIRLNCFCGEGLTTKPAAYTCSGDSGGGWLKKILGKDVVYGVHHGAFLDLNKRCTKTAIATSVCVSTIRMWINQTMNKY
ncbi:trypsin-2-like [Brachyhypopomus gauderio]|uniref:trypsin-2-like n=1 Tax=Brachyhypopomus gauderio TaxID=698409 RepID=UPI00404156A3